MKPHFLIVAAAAALALGSAPVLAAQSEDTLIISTAGIDLASAEGQRALERRIDRAARKFCGVGHVRTGSRIPSTRGRECVAEMSAKARRQLAVKTDTARRGT